MRELEQKLERVDKKVDSHAAQLNDFRREVDHPKTRGTTSATMGSLAATGGTWRSRLLHIRWWAPS